MQTHTLRTRFTKDGKSTEGQLLDYTKDNTNIRFISEAPTSSQSIGKFELLEVRKSGEKEEEIQLTEALDAVYQERYEYTLPNTDKLAALCQRLDQLLEKTLVEDTERTTTPGFENEKLSFARHDYGLLHAEIMRIKACRASIFVGTLGIIGAVAVAILGIIGSKTVSPWEAWLYWTALIPVTLLTVAIVATIQKAQKINMRMGFIEALGEYLASGKLPDHFAGWSKAKLIVHRCKVFYQKHSAHEKCPKDVYTTSNCRLRAKTNTEGFVKHVKFFPNLLHSFTSLSTYVYSFAYIVAIGALLLAIMISIQSRVPTFSKRAFVMYTSLGVIITSIFVLTVYGGRFIARRQRGQQLAKSSAEKAIDWALKYFGLFAGGLVTLLFLALIYAYTKGEQGSWVALVAYALGAAICVTAGIKSYCFCSLVDALRRGRYSAERWRHIWKECFEHCPLMGDPTET